MIVFKTLKWKNFLSTGNKFTEIDFQRNPTTLVVGHNGAGKSTMLDALSFALFGKAHRNISKPQLLNSINNKQCVVEVQFNVSGSEFKIVRGIKPGIFEIWKNGELINQDSHSREYQKILEQNIIKLNHKSFHQIVVLGSSSFIPFMQLSAQNRRDVIEDLLDINIFSKMNGILKEKTSELKENIRQLSYEIDIAKTRIEAQAKYIKEVQQLTQANIDSKNTAILSKQDEIHQRVDQNEVLSEKIEYNQQYIDDRIAKLTDKHTALVQYQAQFKQQMATVAKDARFYEENETCPTCDQDISEGLRSTKLSHAKARAKELKEAMDRAVTESDAVSKNLEEANTSLSELRGWQNTLLSNTKEISRLQSEIDSLRDEISTSAVADLNAAKQELQQYNKQRDDLTEKKLELNEQQQYNTVISEMLKDTGIKTKIIKQYLPVINRLVNQYLQVLDFFVHFDLDESFQETIRSRHRDGFSYDSFSEGEKQRIDLALLFTWRMVAKMKNSVSTNLLILDETFDSSLDYEGVDNLMKIIYTLGDDTNVFVISHKGDILDGKFTSKIEFAKEKNFSQIKGKENAVV
jgi:DNA repair exonuclease SbcCD ATPase subunit